MASLWPDSMPGVDGGRIQFEHRDMGVDLGQVVGNFKAGVAHTTETPHLDLSWSGGVPSHAIGKHRGGSRPVIQQLAPLGHAVTTLRNDPGGKETNRIALVQVEFAGFSSREPWLPDRETQVIYASFMEFCQQELGIPEKRPFADVLEPGITWATAINPRRTQAKWGMVAFSGWWKHVEIPEGNTHWDDGSMRHRVLLKQEPPPPMITAHQIVAAWKAGEHRESEAISPHFKQKADLRAWMVKDGILRFRIWNHLRQGHRIRIATRQVDADKVRD